MTFSVNEYDRDGDRTDKCVKLHIDDHVSLRFEDGEALQEFAHKVLGMLPEIRENYPGAFSDNGNGNER